MSRIDTQEGTTDMTTTDTTNITDTTTSGSGAPLFHGRFIPDQPDQLPLAARLAIGVGLALLIAALSVICANPLEGYGAWITPLIISVLTVGATVAWVVLEIRRPSSERDDTLRAP